MVVMMSQVKDCHSYISVGFILEVCEFGSLKRILYVTWVDHITHALHMSIISYDFALL